MNQKHAELGRLTRALAYRFRDISLLETALNHSSYVNERPDERGQSNERLEFLGDAVLELVVSEMLYERFPQASEGQLSRSRAALIKESSLAEAAQELELGAYLRLSKGAEGEGGRSKPSILSDAMEAVVAAIYLDGGLSAARALSERLLGPRVVLAQCRGPSGDPKSRLQMRVQQHLQQRPRYLLLESRGPDHQKTFKVAVEIDGRPVAEAEGRSKKEAEQNAARLGLAIWPPPESSS